MSVIGNAERTGKVDGTFDLGKYEIRVYYRVVVSDPNDGPGIVFGAPGLPDLYDYYVYGNESDVEMLCRSIQPSRIGDPKTCLWQVVAVYSTPEQKEGGTGDKGDTGGGTGRETPGEFEDPTLEIPTVSMTSTGREKPLTLIFDNITGTVKPCTASNGEPFDPPPRTLETVLQLKISRNEPITSDYPNIAILYTNAVNSDVFWGLAPGTWKIKEILVERQERQIKGGTKVPYLRVTYTFEANPDGWDERHLDYGSFYWKQPAYPSNAPAQRTEIKTAEGKSVTQAPLNGRGLPLFDRKPFTADSGTDELTIVADASGNTLQDAELVQVSNIGGALPAPLRVGTTYYVIGSTGLVFKLASAASRLRITQADNSVSGNIYFTTNSPHGLSNGDSIVIAGVVSLFGFSVYNGSFTVGDVITATQIRVSIDPTTMDEDDLYENGGTIATPINLTTNGTGTNFIWSPGVFFVLRKFQRLPFEFLGLPQSYPDVQ